MNTRRGVLALSLGTLGSTVFSGCSARLPEPSSSDGQMRNLLAESGFSIESITPRQIVQASLRFYREFRFAGLSAEPQSDMLLYQWGVFDWGRGENFEFDMTRQFIQAGLRGGDAISQLHFTAVFPPTPALRSVANANRWCESLMQVPDFESFVLGSAAFQAVADLRPAKVNLEWEKQ